MTAPLRILLITGMSGAGKSTALRTLEDLDWETVDNLPLSLLDRLLDIPTSTADDKRAERSLAIGIDSRTRAFDARAIAERVATLNAAENVDIGILFLDCASAELERRFSENRRRHPLALDRPAADGLARERELLSPLRSAAAQIIDTTDTSVNDLRLEIRKRFGQNQPSGQPTLSIMSFGFAKGLPRNADLVFDVRFLTNPHWQPDLRPKTGLEADVAAYIATDPAYDEARTRLEDLITFLLPRYAAEGKAYLTIAIGCTGGRHRSVHIAEWLFGRLKSAGFSLTVTHRDMGTLPDDMAEDRQNPVASGAVKK